MEVGRGLYLGSILDGPGGTTYRLVDGDPDAPKAIGSAISC